MSTSGQTVEQGNNFMALEPRLVELVRQAVKGKSPAVHVLTTAELAAQCLQQSGLTRAGGGPAVYHFVVSDVPLRFQTIGERFLGRSLGEVEKVDW